LRPEFRQKILSPFHLKSTMIKHFSSFEFHFSNESRLLFPIIDEILNILIMLYNKCC
jgi:hypothetical protein